MRPTPSEIEAERKYGNECQKKSMDPTLSEGEREYWRKEAEKSADRLDDMLYRSGC